MGFLMLLTLAVTGLVVGALARLALPGPDPMGLLVTMLIGVAGSFIGGLIGFFTLGGRGGGFLLAVLCATGIVYAIRRARGGTLTDPGPRGRLGR